MATFLKHEPCPKCGSKDNLGRYDDGSAYCFGCSYTESPNRYTPATNLLLTGPSVRLPEDVTADFTGPGLDWLCSFGISASERIKYRMLWSPSRQQLIFPLYDKSHKLVAWQARNFSPSAKSKYFSQGKIHDVLYFCGKKEAPVILVEDLLSAIKIGRLGCALPLWGSEASTPLLMRLKTHTNGVVIWLDSDKWRNSHDIAKRAQSVGLAALSVFTNKDPKEYDDDYIKYFLTK